MSAHDVMTADGVVDETNEDAVDIDTTVSDDERLGDELAGVVELAAAFLASAGAAELASSFDTFTCGIYSLEELAADLWRLGAWIRGNA